MKKFAIVIAAALLVFAAGATAFAKSTQLGEIEGDASLVLASGPASGFGTSAGLTLGAGMMIPQVKNLQGRVDLSFFSWSDTEFGVDLTYSRVPLTVSARYYFPMKPAQLKVYAQGGLETSFDKVDVYEPFYGKVSDSTTHFGLTPGGGVAYQITDKLSIVADFRYHMITDSYFTMQGGVAYSF